MVIIEDPPGFVVRTEAQRTTWDNGYRIECGEETGWLRYRSTTARGDVWIAASSENGPWFVSIEHAEVSSEIGAEAASAVPGPGTATYAASTLTDLHATLDRIYKLSVSLPDAPLERFRSRVADLPRTTEAERLVVQRIGQSVFREALIDYWGTYSSGRSGSEPM